MNSTTRSSTAFAYVESDLAAGQTLVEWRRERHAARQTERPVRRALRLPRPRRLRWAA